MSHLVPRRAWTLLLGVVLSIAGLAPAVAADPLLVTLTSTPNPSYETETFALVATVDPVPEVGTIRVQMQIDGGPWSTYKLADIDPSGTSSMLAGALNHWQTYAFRAQVMGPAGTVLGTSEPIEHVVALRETFATLALDASTYPFRGTPIARVRFPDIGLASAVQVEIQRPNGSRMGSARRATTTPGQTEAVVELPMDATHIPGDYIAVATFSGSGAWGGSRSESVPFRVTAITTSVTLSTPRLSTDTIADYTVTARVAGSGGAIVGVGSVRFTINGKVSESRSVDADGVARLVVDHQVRQRMGQFGIPLDGRHEIRGAYSFRADGGYTNSTSPVLVHFVGPQVGPSGSVAIYGGAEWAASPSITMSVVASDALEGVAHVRIANDPSLDPDGVLRHGETFPYKQTRAWSLDTSPCASCTGERRTVYVQWADHAGNWSSVGSDTIRLDAGPPTVGAPTIEIDAMPLTAGRVPVKLTWSGTDAHSGIGRFELQVNRNSSGWTSVAVADDARLLRTEITAGDRHQFRVRATDRSGHRSSWVSGPAVRPTLVAERAPGTSYVGMWTALSGSRHLGGEARSATSAGAEVTYAFTGRSIAWLGLRGPDQGVARIFLDGTEVWSVDMVASKASPARVAFTWKWKDARPHVLRIVVAGTAGRPAVTIDGFAILQDP